MINELIKIIGIFLMFITVAYAGFFKDPDFSASIWKSEVTYMYILASLMLYFPVIKLKLTRKQK